MDGLQIKQVAAVTGLTEQRIRKWEERYHAVTPARLDNGYRLYSFADVERLRQIKRLVERGVPISRAVQAVRNDVSGSSLHASNDAPTAMQEFDQEMIQRMLSAGSASKLQQLDGLLRQAYVVLGLQSFIHRVLLPFLRAVGERWETGDWTEYQEHLATLTVRGFLNRCMADMPEPQAWSPVLLTSCVLGERHDLMLNAIMLQAKHLGWSTLFLGADPAPGAVTKSVKALHPNVVLLSVSTLLPLQKMETHAELESINQAAADSAETHYYIGGPANILDTLRTDYPYLHPVPTLGECIAALTLL